MSKEDSELLIIGNGKLALESLKAALIYGTLDLKHKIETIVLVSSEEEFYKIIKDECPDFLCSDYKIRIIETAFHTSNITETIINNEIQISPVIVCTESSSENLNIANAIKELYLKQNLFSEHNSNVFIYHNNNEIAKLINSTPQNKTVITAFGADNSIYSYKNLLNNQIEKLAINIQAVYEMNDKLSKNSILKEFYKTEINKRSCKSNAIHLFYKLSYLGFNANLINNMDEMKQKENTQVLIDNLNNEQKIQNLGRLEHFRWCAFQRSEGWSKASLQEAEAYSKYTNSHKYPDAKLHSCLCSWEELKELQAVFGTDFQELDIRFLKNIPSILGLTQNKNLNISNVKYYITRRF